MNQSLWEPLTVIPLPHHHAIPVNTTTARIANDRLRIKWN
jgi:hypothetical protein